MVEPNEPRHTPKVLVCDDDFTVRFLTRQCLESEGMLVVEASSGEEAIERFSLERPDLVFLDVDMPGLSGLDVCREIRALPYGESTPIMIVTGSDDRETIDQGFEAGATQYKTKPLNWSLLGRDVQYMLRASAAFTSLKKQEDRLRYLAYYDPLTNLPNRRSFNDHLNRTLARLERHGGHAALLFIDLDNFKRINDSIGHGRGDRLLVEIARRLTFELRGEDTVGYLGTASPDHDPMDGVARLGGDEFTVMLSSIDSAQQVESVAKRLLKVLSEPIHLQSHNPVVTPSIGIAMYPQDGAEAEILVRNADTAMYAAKADGRACYRFYNESMNQQASEKLRMEEELRVGIREGQLELRYQPQVDAGTGRVVSLEALVRWKHPHDGVISPSIFIPVAEAAGMVVELGEWVLEEAARHCSLWRAMGLPEFRVCINISPLQFNQTGLADFITRFLERSGMPSGRLELELTETAIMNDAETNISKLRELKDIGLALAVDDFGTGYSSLSYLKRFPIDTLKIDQTFVADLDTSDGEAIVDAIIALARSMNLRVIAEGIETEAQLHKLAAKNCELLQGYLFARPLYPEDVPDMLRQNFSDMIHRVRHNGAASYSLKRPPADEDTASHPIP